MPTTYQGNPSNVTNAASATITNATNANPIVITTAAAHGFQTGDLVDVSGVTGNTAANNPLNAPWAITVIDSTHFSVPAIGNGGWAGGGTAVDRSLTPATTIPSDGDARNAASVNVPLETSIDRSQFLAQRVGKYRMIQQYTLQVGDDGFASWASMVAGAAPLQATVNGATNTAPIIISTTAAHGYTDGDTIQITGVTGNTNANGTWIIHVTDATHFQLIGSSGNAAWISGGTCSRNWVAMTNASPLLSYAITPIANQGDLFDVSITMTCTTSTAPQGLSLGLLLDTVNPPSAAIQPIYGAATKTDVGTTTLRGSTIIGGTYQPRLSGTNGLYFNIGLMLVTNAGSPQTVTLSGPRFLLVNHWRAN